MLATLATSGSRARADVSPSLLGLPVHSITFETPITIDTADYLRQLPLRIGTPLTLETVAASEQWLREKEIFSAVNVAVTPGAAGLDVVFRLDPVPFVVGVDLVVVTEPGERVGVADDELLRRARIREDEALTPEKLASAKRRVVDLLEERGYPHAAAEADVLPVRAGQVRVSLRVRPGEGVRIAEILLTGLDPDSESLARADLSFHVGDLARQTSLEDGRKALLGGLRRRGLYEAECVGTETRSGSGLTLRYDIHAGPKFAIEVWGNETISRRELLGVIELANRPIVTRGTWQLMALRMQERYRERGFRFAEVRVETSEGDPRHVRFEVSEGPQVRVRDIRFVGNHELGTSTLLSAIQTQPTSRRRFWHVLGEPRDLLREDILADDLEQIRALYRTQGYLDAEVREADRQFDEERRMVALTLDIQEGPRATVDAVHVDGAPPALNEPARGLTLEPTQPFVPERIDQDQRHLLARLHSLGFADAKVTTEIEAASLRAETKSIVIRHRIVSGEVVRVGRVIILQNYFTRDSVVRRALPFESGDPLDVQRLTRAQSDIYRLGLFRSVAVRPIQDSGQVRDVAVEVGERPGGEFQYGFGYDTRAGLRSLVQIGHRNLDGLGDQLSLRGDVNLSPSDLAPDEYIVALEGKRPHFLGGAYDLKGSAVRQQSERSIDEFSIRRTAFASGFEREFVTGLRGTTMLEFEDSDVFDVHPDAVLTGQDVGRLRTVTLNPILVYDGRDDAFVPTRGVFESMRLRYGSPAFGSQVHFLKVVLQHVQYVPLSERWTWIYGGRFGLAYPLGFSDTIPLRERFFLGGRTSVRGYDENSIGPRGEDGNPTGGDILINATSEVRFPLVFGLRGAVFVDGGGLYLHDHAISIDDFRESIGPGLRYQTPIGSINLDYGFKIGRRDNESIGEVHFTIGNVF